MISADAIRKILYSGTSVGEDDNSGGSPTSTESRCGFHYQTTYDGPLMNSVQFENASAVQPRSSYLFSGLTLCATTVGCLTMRARHKEKWWMGLFAITVVYFNAMKAHKVDNGLVGHQCAFFGDSALMIGSGCRMMVRSGSMRRNGIIFAVAAGLLWYDIGRFHLWADYVAQLRRELSPERSFNLLQEYVPQDVEREFLFFRGVTRKGAIVS